MVPNSYTPVNLWDVNDPALIAAIVGTPSLVVNFDVFDGDGNLYPAQMTTGALTAAGTPKVVYAGACEATTAF